MQAFDELVLLKRGGVVVYSGKLGRRSADMIAYFESIPGVPSIADGFNPVRPSRERSHTFRVQGLVATGN